MADNPKLVVLSEKLRGKTFTLEADKISIGRSDQRDICLKDSSVSSYHCDFIRQGDDYLLVDNNSTNGSRVNNVPVTTEQLLKGSDIIQLGSVELLYDRTTESFTSGSRTRTGIELGDPSTGLATVPNVANLSPYAQEDRIRTQKTQRLLITGLAILGILLAAAVITILCSLSK